MRWLVAFSWALLISSPAAASLRLGIHAEEPAPSVAGLMQRRLPELALEVNVFEDARVLVDALQSGDLDLAFVEEPTQDISGISMISTLYPSVLHILVPQDEPVQSLDDLLKAVPIWAGTPGGTGYRLARQLGADYGLTDIKLAADPWSADPGAYFIFGGLLQSDALQRLEDFRLYTLDQDTAMGSGNIAEGIALRYPNLRPFLLPAELYPTLSREPALTLAVNTLLVARSGLTDEEVHSLAVAVHRLLPEIAALYPLAGLEALNEGDSTRPLPLHPGAQRFADRGRPGLLERYGEFIGGAVTTVVALITFGVTIYRRRQQARKDRLDVFYQKALQCREALDGSSASAARVADTLRDLQAEVFDLLVAERIDADAALLAFMNLSNQLLREAAENPAARRQ